MPKKTVIIFISVFILTGVIILGFYFYNKNKNNNTNQTTSIFQKFNPFGTSTKVNNSGGDTNTETNNETTKEETGGVSSFHQLTTFAVSGATFFEDKKILPTNTTEVTDTTTKEIPTTTTKGKLATKAKAPAVKKVVEPIFEMVPSIRYVEKSTGHIYQINLSTKEEGKISNSTILGVYETIFNGKADSVLYRYVSSGEKSITTFLATLGGKSNFLTSNIIDISLSPDKSKFFSIIKNKNGVIGNTNSFEDTKSKQVFTSPFSEWLSQWPTEQSIFLSTKPSYLVEGSVFLLNVSTGTISKVLGGITGLTTLVNKDATMILYGASLDIGPRLNIFDISGHTSLDLGVYGLPEKCVWSNDNVNVYCAIPKKIEGVQYPDYWYQGIISFDDYFVKINTKTKEVTTLADSTKETAVDGTNLFLSSKEDKLFFINKKDYTLWSLDL